MNESILRDLFRDSRWDPEYYWEHDPVDNGRNDNYLWCLHCKRTFGVGWFRLRLGEGHPEMLCPYRDCEGTAEDFWPWSVHWGEIPHWPEIPVIGKRYDINEVETAVE